MLWDEKSASWISEAAETASQTLKWSTWSTRGAYLKVAEISFPRMQGSGLIWSFSQSVEMRLLLYFITEQLRYSIWTIFQVWGGKSPLELWKWCNLVFLLLSCRDYTYSCEVWLHAIGCFHPRCWSIGPNLIESRQTFVISKGIAFTDGEIMTLTHPLSQEQWEEVQSVGKHHAFWM